MAVLICNKETNLHSLHTIHGAHICETQVETFQAIHYSTTWEVLEWYSALWQGPAWSEGKGSQPQGQAKL